MNLVEVAEPWPARATERIRAIASSEDFTPSWKKHAREQLEERSLIMGDLLYLLRNGFVFENACPATRKPYWRYQNSMYNPELEKQRSAGCCDP